MIHYRHVLFLTGILAACMASTMVIPVLVDLVMGDLEWQMFAFSGTATLGVALLLILANRPHGPIQLSIKDAFALIAFSWVMIACVVAVPFYFLTNSWPRAFFEGVSAITTTGATTLEGLGEMPYGLLLWRSLLQWVGGIGVVVMALTIFPILKIGGMQLFLRHSSEPAEKILPRVSQVALLTFGTYAVLTVLCWIALILAGMEWGDAICHGLTTMATGGLGTQDESIGGEFMTMPIMAVLTVFMILGGSTLLLVARLLRGDLKSYFGDGQIRGFLKVILVATLICGCWRVFHDSGDISLVMMESLFTVTSIVTTTGFVATDFTSWGSVPAALMFFLTFIGATTGSTSGGIKIFRFQVIGQAAKTYMKSLIYPHGVYLMRCQGVRLDEPVINGVFSFLALYGASYLGLVFALSLCGLDLETALASAVSALSNVGPVPGGAVFATETHAIFSPAVLNCLSVGMLLGRLEFIAVLVLFLPSFWRR